MFLQKRNLYYYCVCMAPMSTCRGMLWEVRFVHSVAFLLPPLCKLQGSDWDCEAFVANTFTCWVLLLTLSCIFIILFFLHWTKKIEFFFCEELERRPFFLEDGLGMFACGTWMAALHASFSLPLQLLFLLRNQVYAKAALLLLARISQRKWWGCSGCSQHWDPVWCFQFCF